MSNALHYRIIILAINNSIIEFQYQFILESLSFNHYPSPSMNIKPSYHNPYLS